MRGPFASPVEAAEANGAAVRRQMQELDVKDPCKLSQCIAHRRPAVAERPCRIARCNEEATASDNLCRWHYWELPFDLRRFIAMGVR